LALEITFTDEAQEWFQSTANNHFKKIIIKDLLLLPIFSGVDIEISEGSSINMRLWFSTSVPMSDLRTHSKRAT